MRFRQKACRIWLRWDQNLRITLNYLDYVKLRSCAHLGDPGKTPAAYGYVLAGMPRIGQITLNVNNLVLFSLKQVQGTVQEALILTVLSESSISIFYASFSHF